jgi:hypothetical protein
MKIIKEVEVLFGIDEAAREVAKLNDEDLAKFLNKVIEFKKIKKERDEKIKKVAQGVRKGISPSSQ